MTTKEAEMTDPQHREILRLSWEAMENAGVRSEDIKGSRTGVFMGVCFSECTVMSREERAVWVRIKSKLLLTKSRQILHSHPKRFP